MLLLLLDLLIFLVVARILHKLLTTRGLLGNTFVGLDKLPDVRQALKRCVNGGHLRVIVINVGDGSEPPYQMFDHIFISHIPLKCEPPQPRAGSKPTVGVHVAL